MDVLYGGIDVLCIILSGIFCGVVMFEKTSKNQQYLLLTFVCGVLITVGDAMEFFSGTWQAALIATKVAYIGKIFIILFALLFSMGFNQIRASKKIILAVDVVSMVLITVIMTCNYHTLFYTSIGWKVLDSGRGVLDLQHGIFFYIWIAEFATGIFWYGLHAFLTLHRKDIIDKEARTRMMLIVISVLGPAFFLIASFVSPMFQEFDWTSVAITFMEAVMLIDVKKYGLLDTMQLAQERILEDTKDGIIVVDFAKKHILFANTNARTIFPEITTGEQKKVIDSIFEKNENVIMEQGRHYELRVSEIKNFQGTNSVQGYVAWIFDMTFIDNYATEMIKLKEESEQANQAKTNFLAHMSHEIRTPMNAIVGFAELALRIKDEDQIQDYLKNIRESAGTLLQLINEILDISKIESGKMEITRVDYSLRELIHELDNMLRQAANRKGLDFIINVDKDIPDNLIGDRQKMQEILLNVINNSIKYTSKGKIEVRVSMREKTGHHVRLHLEVEDSGIGIEKKNYENVFGAFEQFDTRKNYGIEGTGLGLSIVKRLVDMMEGEIRFESVYGEGTTFFIDIKQGLGVENVEPDISLEGVEPRPGHVLVVDDNELNCDVAQGILELMGMKADVTHSGLECLNQITSDPSYELIFMDQMMPEMDGVETLHEIRKLSSEISAIPVVLLTANAVNGVREQMLEEGFDGFLSKPIDVDELKKILVRFFGKKE